METVQTGRIESAMNIKDLIVPCAASLTAVAFLLRTMEMSPGLYTFMTYLAYFVLIASAFAVLTAIIKYFINGKIVAA